MEYQIKQNKWGAGIILYLEKYLEWVERSYLFFEVMIPMQSRQLI